MTLVWVAFGGAVGAVVRFLVGRALSSGRDAALPWGTFAVNLAGSAVFGALGGAATAVPAAVPAAVWHVVGVGFCGALTTWSTLAYETVRLAESGGRGYAVLNLALTLGAGLVLAAAGWLATTALLR